MRVHSPFLRVRFFNVAETGMVVHQLLLLNLENEWCEAIRGELIFFGDAHVVLDAFYFFFHVWFFGAAHALVILWHDDAPSTCAPTTNFRIFSAH